MSDLPRLLLFCTTLDVGGAERVIGRLALGLRDRFHVEAASLFPASAGVAAELRAAGITVHDGLGGRSKLGLPRAVKRLAGLISGQRIDIVASFLFHANVVARLAGALVGPRPHLVTSIRIADERRPWRLEIERAGARMVDRVVCVSDSVRRAADPSGANDRYLTIHNGVPIPASPADLRSGAPWVCVARLDAQKGHDVILGAWRSLGPRAPRLHLVGGGPLLERIRDLVARDGLPIDLLGQRDDVPEILAASGGFVLTSREEGLSNALLEAMAAGLPCVATDVGGAREALDDGRAGVLVPYGDAPALARAVEGIVNDPGHARELATAARSRADSEFPVHRMIDRWAALFARLL